MSHKKKCPLCRGFGIFLLEFPVLPFPFRKFKICENCKGTGKVDNTKGE